MSAATETWVWRMERTQYRNPMTVQLLQAPFVELHATRAGAEPNAGASFPKRRSITSFRFRVVPNSNVLKLEAQDSPDSNWLPVEKVQLI